MFSCIILHYKMHLPHGLQSPLLTNSTDCIGYVWPRSTAHHGESSRFVCMQELWKRSSSLFPSTARSAVNLGHAGCSEDIQAGLPRARLMRPACTLHTEGKSNSNSEWYACSGMNKILPSTDDICVTCTNIVSGLCLGRTGKYCILSYTVIYVGDNQLFFVVYIINIFFYLFSPTPSKLPWTLL